MIIVLIENDLYSFGNKSFMKELSIKFPRTSTLKLNNRNVTDVVETLKSSKPLLTEGWLILANNLKESPALMVSKMVGNNILVLKYQTKNSSVDDIMKMLKSNNIAFKLLDNFNIKEDKLISYVSEELLISETDAKTLVKRCNNYLPYINESLFALKALDRKITRKDILNFVLKRSSFNTLSLFNHVIGYKRVSNDVVSRFLYDFKYALKYLKTDLVDKLEDAILIYSLMNEGLLNARNFKDYEYPRKLKISEYLLRSLVLDIYSEVSFETLLYTRLTILKIESTFQLLQICTS